MIDMHVHLRRSYRDFSAYLRAMDKHGIEKVILHGLPECCTEFCGNADVLRVAKAHSDRVIPSAYIVPSQCTPSELAEHCDAGARGVKLIPSLDVFDWDNPPFPLLEMMKARRMFALVHCGWFLNVEQSVVSSRAHPFAMEAAARWFPEVPFVFAHFGGVPGFLETVVMLSRLPNCYADACPGWGIWPFETRQPGLNREIAGRVMYGTDGAGDAYPASIARHRAALSGCGWSPEDLAGYFGDNARRVLCGIG